ncbi:Exo-alpha-(1-_6)-L-arabinopyranosidase [compost metagenome]
MKAFEVAMEVHQPDSIMTGYNAVNGVFAAADEEMIQGVFREELGFSGYVMTDWGSYETVDIVEAVQAGNCWLTPGTNDDTYVLPIVNGVKEGKIDQARLEKNVWYLLKIVLKRA